MGPFNSNKVYSLHRGDDNNTDYLGKKGLNMYFLKCAINILFPNQGWEHFHATPLFLTAILHNQV